LAFTASLMAFLPSPAGPPGSSPRVRLPPPKRWKDGPHELVLSFRALAKALEPSCVGSSSHGIRVHPPTGIPQARPLPGAEAPFGPTLPHADSCSTLVVSHHLDGLLRARVTGLLHPATGQGFAAFHACRPAGSPESDSIGRDQFPRRGSHPSKTSPRQQPFRITAAVAFLPLPSCPVQVPTEAGVPSPTATPPRRVTYTAWSLPASRWWPCPEGWGASVPWNGGSGASEEVRGSSPFLVRGAPRSSGCRGVTEGPCPSRGGGAGPPRRSGFPAPEGRGAVLRGARCPVPDGSWRAMPRGAPPAWSR